MSKTILSSLFIVLFFFGTAQSDQKKMAKTFKLDTSEIRWLVPDIGSAFATDMITVEGKRVDYMVRQEPEHKGDSGWIFYGGGETQEYMDDPNNTHIFSVNTIANYDPEIIGYLTYPPGTEIERNSNGEFQIISKGTPKPGVIFMYPVNEGTVQITKSWSFDASTLMMRRYDRGSLVIWRPGFTIWLNTYSAGNLPNDARVGKILETMSPENENLLQVTQDGVSKIRYHLEENVDGQLQKSFYIFGIAGNQDIHLTIYYDDPSHKIEVEKIWNSLVCTCT